MKFQVSSRYSGYFEIAIYKELRGERVALLPLESFPILFRTDIAARNCATELKSIWSECADWSLMVGNMLFFRGTKDCCRVIKAHWFRQNILINAKIVRTSELEIPPGYEDRRELFLTLVIDGLI
ncbi:TPA: hypothetical protein I7730_14700 [Vibrio vulnificus]|uniref:Uncharacterized protein n=1 Tax=Vibrio vulnificus TaxID=672 RepID=A0A8H9N1C3_VIBVL|nr:hypothetical protein [Vibrio vulnificus]HAS8541026.1 hypothetical protein [Vibrio vulnificus]